MQAGNYYQDTNSLVWSAVTLYFRLQVAISSVDY